MKIVKLLIRLFFISFVLFFVAASIYVRIYGKSIIEQALNSSLKRNVVLGAVSYQFPFGLRAQDVDIAQSLEGGEFLKVKKIIAHVSPEAIVQGKFAFESVVLFEPSLVVEGAKSPEDLLSDPSPRQGVVVPPVTTQGEEQKGIAQDQGKRPSTEVSVDRLVVKQGKLKYTDGLTEKGFSFSLEDVQLKAQKLVFPVKEGASEFRLSARLIKEGNPLSGSNVQASGWVDVVKRNMEAELEVVEANGTVGLSAKAVSENNDMDVSGEIKMQNLLSGVDKAVAADNSTVNDLVINALSSAGVEIGAKFAFKTQMDNFQVGQISFSGNVVTK